MVDSSAAPPSTAPILHTIPQSTTPWGSATATSEMLPGEQALDGTWHQQHRTELDTGSVVVFSTNFQWGLTTLFARRRYVLVLRNPNAPNQGLVLMEHANLQELSQAAWQLNGEFGGPSPSAANGGGHLGSGQLAYEVYVAITADQELRDELAARATNSASVPPAPPANTCTSASASSSSSAASSSAATPAPAEDAEDCPICFEPIEPSDAAMRCAGTGGRCHYFHQRCMRSWLDNCRRTSDQPTCPVCRGQVQFHSQRLESFLQGGDSANLSDEERGFLQEIANRLRGKGWADAFTLENAKYYTGLFAAAGSGFALGYAQPPLGAGIYLEMYIRTLPREHQIAHGAGWLIGLIIRIVRQSKQNTRREERRERRRHG